MNLRISLTLLLSFLAIPIVAQPRTAGATPGVRSEARVQWYQFGNFFQATDPALEEDVRGIGGEYRLGYRLAQSPTDLYAHANYLNYTGTDRDDTYGGRLGIAHFGRVHELNVFVDRGENRATFDVGDTTATANVTTFSATYGYRITRNWQLGAEATQERQRFEGNGDEIGIRGRNNDYTAVGASVRYRGFGRMFSPEIGYVTGERDVNNALESYDDRYWYGRVIVAPTDRLYMSFRYRDRVREYQTADPTVSNFGREDDRKQWTANAVYQITPRVGTMVYWAREDVQSSRPGRDFDTDLLILGLTFGF